MREERAEGDPSEMSAAGEPVLGLALCRPLGWGPWKQGMVSLDPGTFLFFKLKTAQLIEMDLQTRSFNCKPSQTEKVGVPPTPLCDPGLDERLRSSDRLRVPSLAVPSSCSG